MFTIWVTLGVNDNDKIRTDIFMNSWYLVTPPDTNHNIYIYICTRTHNKTIEFSASCR